MDHDLLRMLDDVRQRSRLKIGLFGSYYPKEALGNLEWLEGALRSQGYNVCLARDLELPSPTTNTQRSLYLLEKSNVNIFVFTFDDGSCGHAFELGMVFGNSDLLSKTIDKTVVCLEYTVDGGRKHHSGSSLILENVTKIRLVEFEQHNRDELLSLILGVLRDIHARYLVERPDDLSGPPLCPQH